MNRGQGTPYQGIASQSEFLTTKNYEMLYQYAYSTIQESEETVTDKSATRLRNVLKHYMTEVAKMNPGKKLNDLNKEAVKETLTQMDSWFRRGGESSSTTAEITRRGGEDSGDRLFSNVGQQFGNLQKERSLILGQAPVIKPEFRDKVEEDTIDPMALFEKARKQREKEGMSIRQTTSTKIDMVLNDDSPEYKIPQTLPQDIIIRQQDVVKYKEIEYNIFINSGDRNWILNQNENRYNFSLNFSPANNSNDFTYSPSLQERFKNIVRIETVKAIVSLESLATVVKVDASQKYDTSAIISPLSYQYVALRIAELNGNGFGTNTKLDNSFAVMHQDTSWTSDVTQKKNRGFASLAPKYLKCQKIYSPTPLASLQKLTIRLERPDGDLLNADSDVVQVNKIVLSDRLDSSYSTSTGYRIGTNNGYIFLITNKFFSQAAFGDTDRILLKGYKVNTTTVDSNDSNLAVETIMDFEQYINVAQGHYIVGTGNCVDTTESTNLRIADGANDAGYCNVIILRSRFKDPITTGGLGRDFFGTRNDAGQENKLSFRIANSNSNQTTCFALNTNRQTHVVLRVVCREMDGASNLRPDNT